MSEQEIIEGNKLIAEFMGIYNQQLLLNTNENIGSQYISYLGDNYISNLKFHKSWDWIMPVVKKIGKIYEDLYKQAVITKIPISYEIESTYANVICRHVTIEINHLFERVVEFIKWYNLCQKN